LTSAASITSAVKSNFIQKVFEVTACCHHVYIGSNLCPSNSS